MNHLSSHSKWPNQIPTDTSQVDGCDQVIADRSAELAIKNGIYRKPQNVRELTAI